MMAGPPSILQEDAPWRALPSAARRRSVQACKCAQFYSRSHDLEPSGVHLDPYRQYSPLQLYLVRISRDTSGTNAAVDRRRQIFSIFWKFGGCLALLAAYARGGSGL